MATSSLNIVPYIIGTLKDIEFSSLLDVGTGFGKWGVLVRHHCDFSKALSPKDLLKENWRIRIDGIEVFPHFVTDLHHYIYNEMYVDDIEMVIDKIGQYDVILMVAVLAHFPEDIGVSLLKKLYNLSNKAFIITIPTIKWAQDDSFENPHEVHYDVKWWNKDFSFAKHITSKDLPQGERILVFSKEGPVKVANPYGGFLTGRKKEIIKKFIGEKAAKALGSWWRDWRRR